MKNLNSAIEGIDDKYTVVLVDHHSRRQLELSGTRAF
jgi:hypothetical protein